MSAICGIYHRDGNPVSLHDLEPTMTALSDYGRDGSDIWHQGPAGLGHQMTYRTAESRLETLPFYDANADIAISADARLDNREELFAMLGISSGDREITDSQLILRAYQKWGVDCPKNLLGDFAFAIWDGQKKHLICARDYIGTRPFYYHNTSERFIFSTSIAGILAFPEVSRNLNLPYIKANLRRNMGQYFHNELTYYTDVCKLPPAHTLVVTQTEVRLETYWEPEHFPEIRFKKDEEYVEHLLELVEEAITCRLRSEYPVGAHISGGLDSSSVAVLAGRLLNARGRSLTAISWAPPYEKLSEVADDERVLIDAICKREGIDILYTPVTPADLMAYQTTDITIHPSHTLRYERVASRMAGERNVRVMLSGWGGDEIPGFNGRGYFAELFLRGRWMRLIKESKIRRDVMDAPIRATLGRQVIGPLVPDWLIPSLPSNIVHKWNIAALDRAMPNCLHPVFARRLRESDSAAGFPDREVPGVRANQIRLLQKGHLTYRMESWSENGAQHGVEYRFPLLDRRIVEYCLSIPSYLFFKDGWKRYMFRRMAEDVLPTEIQWGKHKRDPAVVAGVSLAEMDEVHSLLKAAIQEREEIIRSSRLVDYDCLMLGMNTEERNVHRADALRAMWLAFVSPAATV